MQAAARHPTRQTTVSQFLRELAMHEIRMDESDARSRALAQARRDAQQDAGRPAKASNAPAVGPSPVPKARAAKQANIDAVLRKVNHPG